MKQFDPGDFAVKALFGTALGVGIVLAITAAVLCVLR
jgi:hypothetical protein